VSVSLKRVVELLERRYPPASAADWDAIGLTCGDPDASVARILFAVDAEMSVVDEALMWQADLIVTHHPLLLRGVHSVAATDYKGRVLHTAISHGIALFTAHTNADHATPGVSDALAATLGLTIIRALVPDPDDQMQGTGRIGLLPEPMPLAEFAERVAAVLPATAVGVRVAGDPERLVHAVAVCGGSGDDLLGRAAEVADVYVTSDLRHHPAQEHLAGGGCALIDVPHWAGEWPWLPAAARALEEDVRALGSTVDTHVSEIVTDPWTSHLGSNR
jgi:dinuclear metal center YbgI/SA1388 family protein